MSLLIVSHPACALHAMTPGHPERPERHTAVMDAIQSAGYRDSATWAEAPLVKREHLERIHEPSYLDHVDQHSPESGLIQLDPDTAMGPHSLEAAQRAAGAAILATEQVLGDGGPQRAFCATRPPGHHAERDRAMGFCFYGNAAAAAAHALDHYGLERVAIVDFDVHHGNGTEHIFKNDRRVMFCSTHQHPFYPGTGTESVPGHIVNVPLPAGTDGTTFREAIKTRWMSELETFDPQLLVISAGFDSHHLDPLGGMRLDGGDFGWVTDVLVDFANAHCGGRVVSCLEGGYSLDGLAEGVIEHLRALESSS